MKTQSRKHSSWCHAGSANLSGLDHQYMAYVDGFFTDANSALLYMGYAGGTTDQVCAAILGLHDAIYNKACSKPYLLTAESFWGGLGCR